MINWKECTSISDGEPQWTAENVNAEAFVYEDQFIKRENTKEVTGVLPWHFSIRWADITATYDVFSEIGFNTKEEATEACEKVLEKNNLIKEVTPETEKKEFEIKLNSMRTYVWAASFCTEEHYAKIVVCWEDHDKTSAVQKGGYRGMIFINVKDQHNVYCGLGPTDDWFELQDEIKEVLKQEIFYKDDDLEVVVNAEELFRGCAY